MIFYYHANKTHLHKKGFALGLVLRVRVFGTRKWPICCWLLSLILGFPPGSQFSSLHKITIFQISIRSDVTLETSTVVVVVVAVVVVIVTNDGKDVTGLDYNVKESHLPSSVQAGVVCGENG